MLLEHQHKQNKHQQSHQQEEYLQPHDKNDDDPEPDGNIVQDNHNPPLADDQEVLPVDIVYCICCKQNNATADMNTCLECRQMIHKHGMQALDYLKQKAQEFDDEDELDVDPRGGEPDDGGGDPDDEGGDPDDEGGDPDDVGGDPDDEGGNPDDEGGDPDDEGGDPDDEGDDPDYEDEDHDDEGGDPAGEGVWQRKLNDAEREWAKYFKGKCCL